MEGVKRIVARDDDAWIKRRRINALVRAVGTELFGSTNEETIVKLQPIIHIVSQLNQTA